MDFDAPKSAALLAQVRLLRCVLELSPGRSPCRKNIKRFSIVTVVLE